MMHLNLPWEPKAISVNDSTAGFHCVKMLPMITMILAVRLFQKRHQVKDNHRSRKL